jgi:MFS family permease
MFGLLFYAPLLLQGGFGLSPRETGLLITPLVVCITVGSILNGRLITRLRKPNVMLYLGFLLLALACAGVITTHRGTPHWLIASYMFVAGLGLGFVMPNLTVFAQEVAGRAHLGIATALMQSLRMIGGMLGTAIVGTLVNHSYTGRVTDALAANEGARWTSQLSDPQMLVNVQAQNDFLMTLAHMGQNGALFIEAARSSLVAAIHNGQMVSLAAALAGLWFVRRVPLIRLTRGVKPQPPAGE